MGTSKGYIPPKGYLWKDAKVSITNMAKNNFDSESIGKCLKKYSEARRSNTGSRQGSKQMLLATSKMLNFIYLLNLTGLNESLENIGLESLIGKDNNEIFIGLIDYFSPDNIAIEDSIVRESISTVLKEVDIFSEEIIISNNDLLQRFLVTYMQTSFISNFFEKILGLCGEIKKTNRVIEDIKNNIRITLENNYSIKELINIDWLSQEGQNFISETCDEAFEIFILMEGY